MYIMILFHLRLFMFGLPQITLFQVILGLLDISIDQCFSVCRLRDRGCMSKSVYVCAFNDFELVRYMCISILRCT